MGSRSRRVLAQRKFAQGAYVPPSAAPPLPTNGDRRENNSSGRNFIIQHQVGPSVFVDYISYQALQLNHKGLQPFVMVNRLEVPSRTKATRTELMRNRELVRQKEHDKHRDIHDKTAGFPKSKDNLTNTQTIRQRESIRNKKNNKNKLIVTNKLSDKNNTVTVKDIVKNKNNIKNTEGANKEIVKNKEKVPEKYRAKKNEITNKMLDDKIKEIGKNKERINVLTNKSDREKSQTVKKPKLPTKRVHAMSLRSKCQSKLVSGKKTIASRVTTKLSKVKRTKSKSQHKAIKQDKKIINSPLKSSKRRNSVTTEFSLDDNRPLTYFAKSSTPKQPPVEPVARVSLVPLTTATNATAPVAGPSGLNKKKVTKTRTTKTKTNPYVLLPNIDSPLPAVTSTQKETQPEANDDDPPFYSGSPNIYHWMNRSLDDEHSLRKVRTSQPHTLVPRPCPALRWHTVKELNNADKTQLEARCLKCIACQRIEKLIKLSKTLQSLVRFDVSGDDDVNVAEPNKQGDKVSSDGTIYMELLPKMASSLLKIRTHNVLGKNMLSACLIPRAHARQTKDLSLVEQEGLLEQINATLTASAEAAKGRLKKTVLETCYYTDSSTGQNLPDLCLTFDKRRQQRQPVCAESKQMRESVCAVMPIQAQLQPQRRQSICSALAMQQQPEKQICEPVCVVMPIQAQRRRRHSVCAMEQQPEQHNHESVSAEMPVQAQLQRQRRRSVRAELAMQQQHEQQRRESVCANMAMHAQPQRQRRQSVCAELAMQQQPEQQMIESVRAEMPIQAQPQRQRRQSVCAELAIQQEPEQQRRETVNAKTAMQAPPPPRWRRESVCSELAMRHQPQRKRRESVCVEKAILVQPHLQRRQSAIAELTMQQQPQRQRRESVCVEMEMQAQPERQRRQSVCAELAMQQEPERQRGQSDGVEMEMQAQPVRQRRQSICAELEMPHQPQQQRRESDCVEIETQARPRRQRCQSNCAMQVSQLKTIYEETDETSSDIDFDLGTIKKNTASTENCQQMDLATEAVTGGFDITTIQISTPIANFDMDQLDVQQVEQNYEEHAHEPVEESVEEQPGTSFAKIDTHAELNSSSPLPEDILEMFKKEEPSEQDTVTVTAVKDAEAPSDNSSASGCHLVYDESADAASEARMMAEVDEQARALEKEEDAKGDSGPDKGHSSGTDPNASSGFPNSAEGGQIVDAPVFHPTKEEFDDPIAYFEKILPIAYKYGICKVVPPEGWKPKCKINEDIRFDVTNQYISRLYCRWGPASRELSALKLCLHLQNANVVRPPLVDGVEVNLPKLYHLVQRHGGLENVINMKRWDKVAEEMKFNKSPVIERKLDQIYVKYLLPYATLDHNERQEIMKKVEMAWHHKNQKLLDRATNPLHRQKRMLGESESSDGETEDEGTGNALADAEDCVVSGQCMNFSKFKKIASIAYENHIGIQRPDADMPSIEIIEDRYWRHVVTGTEHLCVNTAAIDTGEEGHGFTKNKNEYYGRHPWNLKMFSQNPGNILRYLGPVLGMTVPTLHLGMIFSTSCWHKDPHALPWTEFMHKGHGRIWYGIPDEQSDNFRKAVETLAPTSCQNKTLWLPTDIAMIPPQILREHNVSLARTVQNPGEFVIVFPKAYSCSISTGYTESESVYFAPRSWLENLGQVIQETRESCEPTMFSLEQLLILMCQDLSIDPDILNLVKPTLDRIVTDELGYRQQLQEKGLKFVTVNATPSKSSRKRNASAYNVRDQDECEYCRATLFFSKVRGLTGRKSSLCLEHALLLLDTDKYKDVNVAQLEVFEYMTVEELNDVVSSVEARVASSS